MTRWVFDIECDGLLPTATRMWILAAKNLDTGKMHYWLEGDFGWKEEFNKATLLVGHNIINYDLAILKKLFEYDLPDTCSVHDTLLMSQILDYKRFGSQGHSLEVWGEHLGRPKVQHEDWTQYSEDMKNRCITDVEINIDLYYILLKELTELAEKAPQIKHYLRSEHAAAKWISQANLHGWPFDVPAAKILMIQLEEEMQKAYDALSSKLGFKCIAVDKKKGIVEPKKPRWTKQGFYDAHTADWFGIHPCSGFEGEENRVLGPYSRVLFAPLDLDSVSDVKLFLFRNGWVPTEWNWKHNEKTNKKEKTSPKVTEDSLEFLGGDGKLYTDFLTTKSRHGILKTWLENIDANGNLHGDCQLIGTPSMRARHSIIVNVPSADSPWGKEMRSLFTCKPGWKTVGCDSSGNQARGLAHYLGDEQFINTLLHGDIHQYNANVLTAVLKTMDINHVVPRPVAKRILYAFLFGASGGKLWSYIFGALDVKQGNQLKKGFLKAVPGFKNLLDKLEKIYGKTSQYGDGYIPGIAGNRLYVDSFHKLLVYLLQAAEKATCSAALMLTAERLRNEGIPYIPLIYYHDEIDFMVPEEFADRAAAIGKQAFHDGPLLFGVTIMDGGAKIGTTWYDVH